MRRKILIAGLAFSALLIAGLLLAQAPAPPPADSAKPEDLDVNIREQFNFVLAPVTVVDQQHNFVNNL